LGAINGNGYKEKLERALDAFQKKYYRNPDMVIWDWIGKRWTKATPTSGRNGRPTTGSPIG
jgi:hypothetical protein